MMTAVAVRMTILKLRKLALDIGLSLHLVS
jgi:hypothetical protein